MKLDKNEKSILARFASGESAGNAVNDLRRAGFESVQMDRVSHYGVANDAGYDNPLQSSSQAGLVLNDVGSFSGANENILAGADPSVSGYGDTNYKVAGGSPFLVTVVTDKVKAGQAQSIIEKHGGKV